jgi:acylphosphatase
MEQMEQTAKHIVFSGEVQGIGFRFTANRLAGRYSVTGFVRNLPDGNVEMLIQGSEQDIRHCIAEIQDSFRGYIRNTKTDSVPPNPSYTNFRVAF